MVTPLSDDDLTAALNKLHSFGDVFFSHEFLEPRPLLRSLQAAGGSVLLIDEIDKSDQEFEAFLLEILSDYQVTIPEIGTISALVPPIVLLTSNSTRDLGDALKRRCLHLHIGFPDEKLEAKIITRPSTRVPIPRGPNHPMNNLLRAGRSVPRSAADTATSRTAISATTAKTTTRQPASRQPTKTA